MILTDGNVWEYLQYLNENNLLLKEKIVINSIEIMDKNKKNNIYFLVILYFNNGTVDSIRIKYVDYNNFLRSKKINKILKRC